MDLFRLGSWQLWQLATGPLAVAINWARCVQRSRVRQLLNAPQTEPQQQGKPCSAGAVWDYLAACKTLANGFGRRFEETYDTIDAIDAPKEEDHKLARYGGSASSATSTRRSASSTTASASAGSPRSFKVGA